MDKEQFIKIIDKQCAKLIEMPMFNEKYFYCTRDQFVYYLKCDYEVFANMLIDIGFDGIRFIPNNFLEEK